MSQRAGYPAGCATYFGILIVGALFAGRVGIFVLMPLLAVLSILALVFILLTPLKDRVPLSVVVAIAVAGPCVLLTSLIGGGRSWTRAEVGGSGRPWAGHGSLFRSFGGLRRS